MVIRSGARNVSHDELIVDDRVLAHHAGYLLRIHWELPHCARGVEVCHPIGWYTGRHPIGQGVGMLPIGLCKISGPIELWLREPRICPWN